MQLTQGSDFSPSGTASAEAEIQKTISGLNGANIAQPWSPQPPSELVQAVNVVARAVTARIAVLQAEINALRAALRPFQQMGQPSQDVFTGGNGGDDAVAQLLDIARKLGNNNA